ncbi:hypothetical protein [Pseudobacteroides cellulosolvens]|uniref:Contractile injection system tube protein N-terminal domain-containing protein n=1 Tax=Pseudobacteroides cellulosolvens ATCC 35603 = DSM 2933 TaxID=398512 RepID=A0A0L6JHX4_9FIRM|nr:hypothetical protein [Pseudobacteroides cellulosolvens]KNY25324.1 hypothetical protein Bccel_0584 [Pseudobacteroides cellulosolvens ATCC 35603 = DSM 2933]
MGLEKARIIVMKSDGGIEEIPVQFNPDKYSITTDATMSDKKGVSGGVMNRPLANCSETLKVSLIFDTFEEKVSVRKYTNKLAKLVNSYRKPNESESTPNCKFVWGRFIFKGYVNNITQNFTMFLTDGKPVRANVDITIKSDVAIEPEKED